MTNKMKCSVCGDPAEKDFMPFCSKRCADIDLGRWFKGDYRFESSEVPDEQDFVEAMKEQQGLDK